MPQRLWVADNVIARVESGAVTIQIDKPTRHLLREQDLPGGKGKTNPAFEVADKIWFAAQMRELAIARARGETKEIPLTDRRRRSSLRLGGGFMITQGTKLVLPRRHLDAPRPGQFSECGGVFEYHSEDPAGDPDDVRNDFVAALLKESQEIVIVRGDTLYIPQLAPPPSGQIGFQPPGTLEAYNRIIEEEVKDEVKDAEIPVDPTKVRRFWMKVVDYEQAVRLQFAYSPELSVDITAEVDTSSLECVGVLSYPEDIDQAVAAFEGKSHVEVSQEESTHIQKLDEFQYWDAELDKEHKPVHREIHVIDIRSGDDRIWSTRTKGQVRTRVSKDSDVWKELSKIKLGKTGGRFATEKLEKAIKMHCPFPILQPLVRL